MSQCLHVSLLSNELNLFYLNIVNLFKKCKFKYFQEHGESILVMEPHCFEEGSTSSYHRCHHLVGLKDYLVDVTEKQRKFGQDDIFCSLGTTKQVVKK